MNYYLVAGEASGDLHGSLLIKELRSLDSRARIRFVGGDLMKTASGEEPFLHYKSMAFMGFWEVITHLHTIRHNLNSCKADISSFKPDVLILIDFSGFNMRLAKYAHALGHKVFYFISPKVWAWNQNRVLKIKECVDRMFVIFPFEVEFYKKWGMEVDYVGNPLMDAISAFKESTAKSARSGELEGTKPIIALLPGSRVQEITRILPEMLKVLPHFPDYQFIIAQAPAFDEAFYAKFTKTANVQREKGNTYELLCRSKAALVASGTATLETALLQIPEVVLYKTSTFTIILARMLVKLRFISLVNLIMDKEVVRELIQEQCREDNIVPALREILPGGASRQNVLADYELLQTTVGGPGAAMEAAKKMYGYLCE